jgi:DNA-binding transcriptional ArsR family regulator
MERPDSAGDGGTSAAEAFAILGNETRVETLLALWRAGEPVPFARLRRAVAPDDKGNFSYHLGKLADHFVEKTDEGYALRFAGEQVVRAVLAGTITESDSLPTDELGERCVYCGGAVEMSYENEHISVQCTECDGVVGREFPPGTYMHYGFPPAGLAGRTREEVVDAAHVLYDSKIAPMMKGVCPECAGQVTLSYDICEDHQVDDERICPQCDTRFEVWAIYECGRCKYRRTAAMWFAALNHPAVIAFYHEHGLDETIPFRKLTWENARFVRGIAQTVVDTDPYRFRVRIPVDGEALVVSLDETLDVLSVERESIGESD